MKIKVPTADGTTLAASISGPDTAGLTVVLAHGFCMNSSSWARTRRTLAAACPDVQVVTYDHRGHGHSADGPRHSHTVETLADDLAAVIDAVAGDGPLILGGHSLGAMTILACLRRHPHLVSQVRGTALVATASSCIADHGGIARLLPKPIGHALPGVAQRLPCLFNSVWGLVRTAMSPALGNCGTLRRPSSMVLAELLSSLLDLDESSSLHRLAGIPTVVVAGAQDFITPVAHAEAIAAGVPRSSLRVVPHAGHNLVLTDPEIVARELIELVTAAMVSAADAAPVRLAAAGS
ncbi:alpha/beta fold hydrolase [Gordonia aichiensis]|uniref:alpha/beta fold hydrolase n=1 Tax=Gordonia aichiensis TaxID=36820 RepID=UPI0032646AD2